jgi:hypothetical protein
MSAPYQGDSTSGVPGVTGTNTTTDGAGVLGRSAAGPGVVGEGGPGAGDATLGYFTATIGVVGKTSSDNDQAYGVYGEGRFGAGVRGSAPDGDGVQGFSGRFSGVSGESKDGAGLRGVSAHGEGVHAETSSDSMAAVTAIQLNPRSPGSGVYAQHRGAGPGGFFASKEGEGVHGETSSIDFAAVAGIQLNPRSAGAGVYGEHRGAGPAGFFKGNVVVTEDIQLTNADCAEEFEICAEAGLLEPGCVAVIDEDGLLRRSEQAYDRRVAGVVSGAGAYRPAIVLDRQHASQDRLPIALVGKVYCKVDAEYGAIAFGDLLTPSATPGHAMKVDDPHKAFGAVIGKALGVLAEGQGLIPILVALQ